MIVSGQYGEGRGRDESVARAELDRLLVTGPFSEALRAAVRRRGLGMERLRAKLHERGVSVSVATLSYWQSGRSRPERRRSLLAVAELETILEVPSGALAALLGPPRRRGRWSGTASNRPEVGAFWPEPSEVTDLVRAVDTRWDERLTRISQHDRIVIGPDRGERSTLSRQVLRAEAEGPDRWVVILHLDEHDRPLPRLRPVRHCRLGRVVRRPEIGLLVAELLFEQPLSRGETVITEHEFVNVAPCPLASNYERKFRLPVREFVLEVSFHPEALPVRCVRFQQEASQPETVEDVRVSSGHSVHGVALNFGPGRYGFRWDWSSADA